MQLSFEVFSSSFCLSQSCLHYDVLWAMPSQDGGQTCTAKWVDQTGARLRELCQFALHHLSELAPTVPVVGVSKCHHQSFQRCTCWLSSDICIGEETPIDDQIRVEFCVVTLTVCRNNAYQRDCR
jgi:hypothetical protein